MSQQQQQHQQYPPRVFSPPLQIDSPHYGPPGSFSQATKRQRLSPNPQSPYNSPSLSNIALPNQVFSSPYYGAQGNGSQVNGATPNQPYSSNHNYNNQANTNYHSNNQYNPNSHYTPNNHYNTINPPPAQSAPPPQAPPTGTMGPPARPLDNKPTDINELGDVLAGSGVDLREEEAALLGSYSRSGQQRQDTGYGPNLGKPFGSNYPIPQGNFYSQNFPGDRNSFYGAGTFNQRPAPFQSAEAIAAADREKAIRRKAEIKSYHLNDPFLFTGCLQRRIAKQAQNMQVVVPQAGLLHSTTPQHVAHELYVQGPDKNEVLKVVKGEDLLQTDSLYAEILSLLSLATEERLRTLVEDAATLAKGRRIGAHGIVPVELADIAIGSGASETVTGLPMQGNSVVSPTSNPLKRSYAEMNKPLTAISANGPISSSTVAFRNPVAQALQNITQIERAQEEERLEKRRRRAATGDPSRSVSLALDAPGPCTPGSFGLTAPDIETRKGAKAKEQMSAAARKATEAQQHAATTKTMNMALGISLPGKKLSWMSKGADAGPSNPFLAGRPNANAQSSKVGASGANGVTGSLPKSRVIGDFREDKETGAGIQLRDMVSVLEHDGKEKRALQRAYGRLGGQER